MKTRKLSARGGRAAPAGGDTPTGTNAAQQRNSNRPNDARLGADWFVCGGVFVFFSFAHHIGGLCCAAHQFGDDIIVSEEQLLYLGTDGVLGCRLTGIWTETERMEPA